MQRLLRAAGFGLMFFVGGQAIADANQIAEHQMKAMYIKLLSEKLSWPEPSNRRYVCIYGDNGVFEFLDRMLDNQKKIFIPKLFAVNYSQNSDVPCDIVYISQNGAQDFEAIRQKLSSRSVAYLTDEEKLLSQGADIAIATKSTRVIEDEKPDPAREKMLKKMHDSMNQYRKSKKQPPIDFSHKTQKTPQTDTEKKIHLRVNAENLQKKNINIDPVVLSLQ